MKQEILNEASAYYAHNYFNMHEINNYKALKQGFEEGAKWQQERMYSEEELREAFNKGMTFERGEYQSENTYNKFTGFQKPNKELSFEEWFNQFKKK